MLLKGISETTRYSATAFRQMLDCMARPGKINRLEYPHFLGEAPVYHRAGQTVAANLYALGALLTLLEKEVTFAVAAEGQWLPRQASVTRWLALRSGAVPACPQEAAFACFCDGRGAGLVTQLDRGTLLEPERSATAFYCVTRLASVAGATDASGMPESSTDPWLMLELKGPGIEHVRMLHIMGLDTGEIEQLEIARHDYPLGIDACFVDTIGNCVALPRTTRIRMVEQSNGKG